VLIGLTQKRRDDLSNSKDILQLSSFVCKNWQIQESVCNTQILSYMKETPILFIRAVCIPETIMIEDTLKVSFLINMSADLHFASWVVSSEKQYMIQPRHIVQGDGEHFALFK
jgi:hypothetical protein